MPLNKPIYKDYFNYKVIKKDTDSNARAGEFYTPHGSVNTPVFMPVGTNSAVKMLTCAHLLDAGAQIILNNSYHLYLRAGTELIKKAGGLHSFQNWHKPILTDSGGFQIFSLPGLRKIAEDGVKFQDPKNGSYHFITPETSIKIQNDLGADIIMAFDECVPYPCNYSNAKLALEKTTRWLQRCFTAHKNPNQALFPIVQGAFFEDLRIEAAKKVSEFDAAGYAIGGVSVGEPLNVKNEIVELTAPLLPYDKPRYLMGVGTPIDILNGIKSGIDMFDCVLPTRNARHGAFFTYEGNKIIKNKEFEEDFTPLEPECACYSCTHHTKAYIRHLFKVQESTAATLISIHNIHFLINFTNQIRSAILKGNFNEFFEFYKTRFDKSKK